MKYWLGLYNGQFFGELKMTSLKICQDHCGGILNNSGEVLKNNKIFDANGSQGGSFNILFSMLLIILLQNIRKKIVYNI